MIQRMALVALDQMAGGGLEANTVSHLLSSPESRLRQTAMWIAKNHPDWGGALRDYFDSRLRSDTSLPGQAEQLQAQLATFAGSEPIQELIGMHLANRTTPTSTTKLLLGTIAAAPLKEIPASWLEAVAGCLAHSNENVVRAAVAAARTLNLTKSAGQELDASLTKLASDTARPEDLRLQALSAMSETSGPLAPCLADVVADEC